MNRFFLLALAATLGSTVACDRDDISARYEELRHEYSEWLGHIAGESHA